MLADDGRLPGVVGYNTYAKRLTKLLENQLTNDK
jgi:hypothetical protein